jgi:hypothetical protein
MDKTAKHVVTINNKRIYDYYKSNPNINIESMNLILLDFMEQIGNDMSRLISNTITGEILENVKEIKQSMSTLNDQISLKFHEHNKSFLDTIKMVISVASTDSTDKTIQTLTTNINGFMERITASLPKLQEQSSSKLFEFLSTFKTTITKDIQEYISTSNKDSDIQEYIKTLDSKIASMQQPIYSFISSTQEQISSKLGSLREDTTNNDKVIAELSEFLSKYKTSSQFKGQCSENMLGNVLNKMYPTGEVTNTTALKASCDFILKRPNKQPIMFENKNYEANVNLDEIKKFLRDVNEQKINAIMLSQYSGIVSKPNGFIEIHDGKVIIYLHSVDYSQEKIKMAVDIVDNLSDKLDELISMDGEDSGIVIKKDVLDRINEQFQMFLSQKELLTITLKEMNKKLLYQVEELKMPDLSMFLNDKYASMQNQQFCCEICNLPFQNKRSLASHKKIHKTKSSEMTVNIEVSTDD